MGQQSSRRKVSNSDGTMEAQADVNIPKLEQLSKIIENLNEQLTQKVLEVEQEHGINSKHRMGLIENMGEAMKKGGDTAAPPTTTNQDQPAVDYENSELSQ